MLMDEVAYLYNQASLKTAANLRTMAHSFQGLSRLSLPEIAGITDLISQVVPASNVPGMVLSGLARLQERRPLSTTVRRDIDLRLRDVEQVLDQVVYSTFFAGPAAVLWGYHNLLLLAAKDPVSAFPDGIWQFYLEYALREDTARHTTETHGFDTALVEQHVQLSTVDRITAWTIAAIHCLHQFSSLRDFRPHVRLLQQAGQEALAYSHDTGLSRKLRQRAKPTDCRAAADRIGQADLRG